MGTGNHTGPTDAGRWGSSPPIPVHLRLKAEGRAVLPKAPGDAAAIALDPSPVCPPTAAPS